MKTLYHLSHISLACYHLLFLPTVRTSSCVYISLITISLQYFPCHPTLSNISTDVICKRTVRLIISALQFLQYTCLGCTRKVHMRLLEVCPGEDFSRTWTVPRIAESSKQTVDTQNSLKAFT